MCVTVGVMDIDVITDGVGELLRYIKIFRKIYRIFTLVLQNFSGY
jgi:hypothetical protein